MTDLSDWDRFIVSTIVFMLLVGLVLLFVAREWGFRLW